MIEKAQSRYRKNYGGSTLIKIIFLGIVGCVLLLLFITTFIGNITDKVIVIPNIGILLPDDIEGWRSEDFPVGDTEEVKRKMGEVLKYDAALFRQYSKGLIQIQVYISYWRPGKAHFRIVNGHTPDVCWVRAGWKPTVQNPSFNFSLETEPFLKLKIGQYREFSKGDELIRVIFWQLLDGEPFTYGNFGEPPVTAIFSDIISRGFNQKPEQWFIRISANIDFKSLESDEGFQLLMRSMTQFGLEAKNISDS